MVPEAKPPVILTLNCPFPHEVMGEIGHFNQFTDQLFGCRPLNLATSWIKLDSWWLNPLEPEAMKHILFEVQPNFSKHQAERWVHETGFVLRVRHGVILKSLTASLNSTGVEGFFTEEWQQSVKIAVFDDVFLRPGCRDFAKRVFLGHDLDDPLFPNAVHYSHSRCVSGLNRIWAAELEAAKSGGSAPASSQLENPGRPILHLAMPTRYVTSLNKHGYLQISDLVAVDAAELLSKRGINQATIRAVRKALKNDGLHLKGEGPSA